MYTAKSWGWQVAQRWLPDEAVVTGPVYPAGNLYLRNRTIALFSLVTAIHSHSSNLRFEGSCILGHHKVKSPTFHHSLVNTSPLLQLLLHALWHVTSPERMEKMLKCC